MMHSRKGKIKAKDHASSQSSSAKSTQEPPSPFLRPPQSLSDIISNLDPSHVYVLSLDTTSPDLKKKIFLVPVLTNIALLGFLAWRIWIVAPVYFKIGCSVLGVQNEMTLHLDSVTQRALFYELGKRGLKFLCDLCIYVFLWPWPQAFFFGRVTGNPVSWRFAVPFLEREIVVRRSRRWDEALREEDVAYEGTARNLLVQQIETGTNTAYMRDRTAYLLLNKDWDLDWRLMVICHNLVKKGQLSMESFKTTVFVHSEEFGWLQYETRDIDGSAQEEEGRKKILAFKDELTAIGKENLFFRWVELVQYESSQPGGFGLDRQLETTKKAKSMFEAQGVDFELFWGKIGGMAGMPGMDQ